MTHASGKLALPTIDTCRFRRDALRTESGEDAVCGLVQTLVPGLDAELCRVRRETCAACCRSFPPSADTFNPVVASVCYDIAARILKDASAAAALVEQIRTVKALAEPAIDTASGGAGSLIPLRTCQACVYLGSARDDPSTAAGFECHHPAHRVTTASQCLLCRDWLPERPISPGLSLEEMLPPPKCVSGDRVLRWAVGVTTAPRKQMTLEWCLDSLARAGWEQPHLFLDGTIRVPERYSHLQVTWRETGVGAWPNYFLALHELLMLEPDADAYLLVQDDANVFDSHNLREYLERALWPGPRHGIVSLYCPEPYNAGSAGWHQLNQAWLWGALAFVFPAHLARAFAGDPQVVSHRWANRDTGRLGIDSLLGSWTRAHHVDVWYPIPSLVQHVGNTSAIWHAADNAGPRRADWFAGDIDARFATGNSFDAFPESAFPCHPGLEAAYTARVAAGRDRMREATVVICGLCRDVRHYLPRFASRVERLGALFRDYQVVLYENDSADRTLEFLEDWSRKNPRIHVLSDQLGALSYPQVRSAERATKLALYRNRCREYAVRHFAQSHFLIVADADLAGGWSFDGIASTFGHEDWDFVGSNGLAKRRFENPEDQPGYIHFDAWAFRKAGHPAPHPNHEVNGLVFRRGQPLVPVWSCFGGLGVYRIESLRNSAYSGPDCEHVELHQRMHEQGFHRRFLNPSQIVLYTNSNALLL